MYLEDSIGSFLEKLKWLLKLFLIGDAFISLVKIWAKPGLFCLFSFFLEYNFGYKLKKAY